MMRAATKNAPVVVGATDEGVSRSRWSGSQNEVPAPVKEQNMTSLAASTDTDKPEVFYEERPELLHDFGDGKPVSAIEHLSRVGAAQFGDTLIFAYEDLSDEDGPAVAVVLDGSEDLTPFHVWLDQTDTGMLVRCRVVDDSATADDDDDDDDTIARQRIASVASLLEQVPERDRCIAASVVARRPDLSAEAIVRTYIPAFPAPSGKRPPKWVEAAGEPTWEAVEQYWARDLRWTREWPEGGGVRMSATECTRADEKPFVDFFGVDVTVESIETAEEARQVAVWLLEAADALDGPRPVDNLTRRPEPMGTQRRVVENVRRLVKKVAYSQTEVAITAGYGMDEFSSFMTGRRLMDLTDVDRIATALRVSPLELLSDDEAA